MAITEAFKEAKWLKGLVREISSCSMEVSVFCDSQSAIHLAKSLLGQLFSFPTALAGALKVREGDAALMVEARSLQTIS